MNEEFYVVEVENNEEKFINLFNRFLLLSTKGYHPIEKYFVNDIMILGFTVTLKDNNLDKPYFIGYGFDDNSGYMYFCNIKSSNAIKQKISNDQIKEIKKAVISSHLLSRMDEVLKYGTLRLYFNEGETK